MSRTVFINNRPQCAKCGHVMAQWEIYEGCTECKKLRQMALCNEARYLAAMDSSPKERPAALAIVGREAAKKRLETMIAEDGWE